MYPHHIPSYSVLTEPTILVVPPKPPKIDNIYQWLLCCPPLHLPIQMFLPPDQALFPHPIFPPWILYNPGAPLTPDSILTLLWTHLSLEPQTALQSTPSSDAPFPPWLSHCFGS